MSKKIIENTEVIEETDVTGDSCQLELEEESDVFYQSEDDNNDLAKSVVGIIGGGAVVIGVATKLIKLYRDKKASKQNETDQRSFKSKIKESKEALKNIWGKTETTVGQSYVSAIEESDEQSEAAEK